MSVRLWLSHNTPCEGIRAHKPDLVGNRREFVEVETRTLDDFSPLIRRMSNSPEESIRRLVEEYRFSMFIVGHDTRLGLQVRRT